MKKRRTLIIAALLVAALALGIGYAALSRDLQINGSANLQGDNEDFDISFTSGTAAPTDAATVTVVPGTTTASYVIDGLSEVGDTLKLTFVVTNNTTDVDAHLASITSTINKVVLTDDNGVDTEADYDDYFTKTLTITNEDGDTYVEGQDFVVAPGKTATVVIDITLTRTVTQKLSTSSFIALHFKGQN